LGCLVGHGFEGSDDSFQVGLDLAVVVDEAELTVGFGGGDQLSRFGGW
jgi:hypothetical protein